MATSDFSTIITVNKSAEEVFNAINNVRGWWQGDIEGSAEKTGDEFSYRMKDFHFSRQRLVESVPNKKVVWLVTDSNLSSFPDKSEWTGTKITFEIEPLGNSTQLRFTHQGLVPAFECYGACSGAWGALIQKSLKSLVESGEGVNVFG